MAVGPLTISLRTNLICQQLGQLKLLLEQLPKRRARRFGRKAYRLLASGTASHFRNSQGRVARHAGDLAFEIRILGMDELIAAAMRAGKRNFAHGGPREG